ncbi:MAG: hypothetical protein RBQ84_05625 [Arcobacter sp.]|jgi:hypothetical protein|uniref:Uncharacterized protein n=1 Tax=Arcobacter defluvii TaxID=873191 RepID=A0AAE7E5K5_9BACT|nr:MULTISPECIES: hypothetical protein [Arcobacter]MDY3200415.1 hypothetical protein [Arcobacter sp.]QKF76417.1 hypothetical protein ADFLV_0357 [Arcobacter defluvii]RXI34566.1 hypothetical protein CP964_00270 [Arcobacter defluvii]
MIVAVKRNRKQKFIKLISLVVLIAMFGGYYYYMNKTFEEKQKQELQEKQALKIEEEKKEKAKKNLERAILSEVEKAVDLVGQEHIKHVKLIENKVVIVCEPDTNLDALIVRYGVMALIKRTLTEVIVAVDINFILKSKSNEKK